jgi:DNA-binding NarL/FixJ family response regulator
VTAESVDVLLLDMRMPGMGGIEVCRQVRNNCPSTRVLALTSFDDDDEVFGILAVGATGYLLKDTRPDRLVEAIRAVADGQAVLDPKVANRVIASPPQQRVPAGNGEDESGLSRRELEVLRLMAEGMSNKEIGRSLWIGETTVKTHVSHILRKLGQSDRTQAVLAAVKLGLVDLDNRNSDDTHRRL